MTILSRLLDPGAEQRSTLANPDDWLIDSLTGGSRTLSGEVITPSKALALSSYFAALRAISEDIGKLPFHIFRQTKPRGKERLRDHPLARLLDLEANPEMSSQSFREVLTSHALGWGGGFAEIQRRGDVPIALWPLDPSWVTIERDRDTHALQYVVRNSERAEVRLRPRDVFHVHGLGFDGITGYSIAKTAKQSLGLGIATEKSGAAFFGNAAMPSGVLETPEVITDEGKIKLKAAWELAHRGTDNAHRTAVLEAGMTFRPLSIPNKDAEWIASRQFTVEDVARWFRIPPHKIQHLLRSTFSNIAHQSIEYVTDTLLSWLVRWEREVIRKLIPHPDQALIVPEHVVEGLLRGDMPTRFEGYQKAILTGWMTRNEARALENLNPDENLDVFLEPLNMAPAGSTDADDEDNENESAGLRRVSGREGERGPVGKKGDPGAEGPKGSEGKSGDDGSDGLNGERGEKGVRGEPGPPADNTIDAAKVDKLLAAHVQPFVKAYEWLLRFETGKVERAVKRGDLGKWADKFYVEHSEQVRGVLQAPIEAFCRSMYVFAVNDVLPDGISRAIATYTVDIVERHVKRSLADLKHEPLDDVLKEWRNGRARDAAIEELRTLAAVMVEMMDKRTTEE